MDEREFLFAAVKLGGKTGIEARVAIALEVERLRIERGLQVDNLRIHEAIWRAENQRNTALARSEEALRQVAEPSSPHPDRQLPGDAPSTPVESTKPPQSPSPLRKRKAVSVGNHS